MKSFQLFTFYSLFFFGLTCNVYFTARRNIDPSLHITKVVIPAAGLGTRFLPFTKAVPKEMLPITNQPAFQFIINEALNASINQFITIANENKQAIVDYLSHMPSLERMLRKHGKYHLIAEVNKIIDGSSFAYIPQPELLGLGHAVLMAQDAVGYEYFGVMLPDEIFFGETSVIGQLTALAQKYQANVVAVREVPMEKVSRYAVITIQTELEENVFMIENIIEKPAIEKAPSNLATCGRYVFSPVIFTVLSSIEPGHGGEIQLTDAINHLIKIGEPVIAVNIIDDQPYDIGNPLGWLEANITYAMNHPQYSEPIKKLCTKLMSN